MKTTIDIPDEIFRLATSSITRFGLNHHGPGKPPRGPAAMPTGFQVLSRAVTILAVAWLAAATPAADVHLVPHGNDTADGSAELSNEIAIAEGVR